MIMIRQKTPTSGPKPPLRFSIMIFPVLPINNSFVGGGITLDLSVFSYNTPKMERSNSQMKSIDLEKGSWSYSETMLLRTMIPESMRTVTMRYPDILIT